MHQPQTFKLWCVYVIFLFNTHWICVCLDDMLIKLWDWEKKWSCSQVFEGHTHYVMQIVINPKDNNQFASASLDRTIKVHLKTCVDRASLTLACDISPIISSVFCFRFGSWALLLLTSLWRAMIRVWTALIITVEEINPTSYLELMTDWLRFGTIRYEWCWKYWSA